MPQLKHFPLPDVGEGLTEAEILKWRVQPGETVTVNQIIVEIETAKSAVELPSPFAGTVTELLGAEGQTVEVGTSIIVIDVDPEGTSANQPGTAADTGEVASLVGYGPRAGSARRRPRKDTARLGTAPESIAAEPEPVAEAPDPSASRAGLVPLAKPPVRKLAKDLGIDLRSLTGTGNGGVITRSDVEAARAERGRPQPGAARGERRVPVSGVRRMTARAMVASAFTAPHVTEFLAVDVTPMMELRDRLRQRSEFAEVKLSPLVFAAKAVCLAIRRTPDVNAAWDEQAQEIVYPDYVNLGIAAATPRGLIVPNVRDADRLSLRELATELAALTATAREGKTPPSEMAGGTFTITNVGVFGVDAGTPILNPGEAGILALGAVRDLPWVVDGEVVPRKVCQLALSFDHRVVDGEQGSRFLADVGALLGDPGVAMTY